MQVTHNSGLWLAERQKEIAEDIMWNDDKILGRNFEKSFLEWKKWLRERSSSTSSMQIFSCLYHLSDHMVFLVQLGITLHLWVFQKAENAIAKVARWKIHLCKLIPS